MSKQIEVIEVGPRDGFQSVKCTPPIPTEIKLDVIDRLVVDPQIAGARGMFPTIDQPGIGELQITAIPAHTTRTSTAPRKAAPLLGEDNADVYGKLLGLDEAKLADLKAKGVI